MKRKYGVTQFTKVCGECGTEKPLGDFYAKGLGWDSLCKPCRSQRTLMWQARNPEKKRAKQQRWNVQHKDEKNARERERRKRPDVRISERAYRKAYRKAHPDTTTRLWNKRWNARHPDRAKMYKRRAYEKVKADRDRWQKLRDASAKWIREHPQRIAELRRQACAIRRARQAGVLCDLSNETIVGRWAMFGNRCWVCGKSGQASDHVKPLKYGGAHIGANIRPICRSCNSRKGTTWPFQKVAALCQF